LLSWRNRSEKSEEVFEKLVIRRISAEVFKVRSSPRILLEACWELFGLFGYTKEKIAAEKSAMIRQVKLK
jgi:hypothetical protein